MTKPQALAGLRALDTTLADAGRLGPPLPQHVQANVLTLVAWLVLMCDHAEQAALPACLERELPPVFLPVNAEFGARIRTAVAGLVANPPAAGARSDAWAPVLGAARVLAECVRVQVHQNWTRFEGADPPPIIRRVPAVGPARRSQGR